MSTFIVHIFDGTGTSDDSGIDLMLDPNSTIEELQTELKDEAGLAPNDYRLYYQRNTHKEPLEENEVLSDITKEDGKFVAEMKPMSVLRR